MPRHEFFHVKLVLRVMFLWAAERYLGWESQPHWHLLLLGYVLQGRLAHPMAPPASLHYALHPTHVGCWKWALRNTTKRGMERGRPLTAHSVWALDIWASFSLSKQWGDSPTKVGVSIPIPSCRDLQAEMGQKGWGPLNPDAKAYGTSRQRLEACSCWVEKKGIPSSLECPPEASSFPFGKDERNIIHLLCRTSLPSLSLFTRPSESSQLRWGASQQMVRGTHQLQPQPGCDSFHCTRCFSFSLEFGFRKREQPNIS